jgi:hypothetical protein
LRDTAATGGAGIFASSQIADAMRHDCEIAAEVVSLLAPNRKIQMPWETPKLLVDILRQAAQEEIS